ncbi:hypothetical protein RRG08_027869 [Elysia crispata]|uniref:Uncharacterized protein n=1 Tax=Elysia crispata TaxID=231223 RepID=A0AAE1A8D8_9GAST|nr:hypothetical protein RRG08_027869 [Elysia crispata]
MIEAVAPEPPTPEPSCHRGLACFPSPSPPHNFTQTRTAFLHQTSATDTAQKPSSRLYLNEQYWLCDPAHPSIPLSSGRRPVSAVSRGLWTQGEPDQPLSSPSLPEIGPWGAVRTQRRDRTASSHIFYR